MFCTVSFSFHSFVGFAPYSVCLYSVSLFASCGSKGYGYGVTAVEMECLSAKKNKIHTIFKVFRSSSLVVRVFIVRAFKLLHTLDTMRHRVVPHVLTHTIHSMMGIFVFFFSCGEFKIHAKHCLICSKSKQLWFFHRKCVWASSDGQSNGRTDSIYMVTHSIRYAKALTTNQYTWLMTFCAVCSPFTRGGRWHANGNYRIPNRRTSSIIQTFIFYVNIHEMTMYISKIACFPVMCWIKWQFPPNIPMQTEIAYYFSLRLADVGRCWFVEATIRRSFTRTTAHKSRLIIIYFFSAIVARCQPVIIPRIISVSMEYF